MRSQVSGDGYDDDGYHLNDADALEYLDVLDECPNDGYDGGDRDGDHDDVFHHYLDEVYPAAAFDGIVSIDPAALGVPLGFATCVYYGIPELWAS